MLTKNKKSKEAPVFSYLKQSGGRWVADINGYIHASKHFSFFLASISVVSLTEKFFY